MFSGVEEGDLGPTLRVGTQGGDASATSRLTDAGDAAYYAALRDLLQQLGRRGVLVGVPPQRVGRLRPHFRRQLLVQKGLAHEPGCSLRVGRPSTANRFSFQVPLRLVGASDNTSSPASLTAESSRGWALR